MSRNPKPTAEELRFVYDLILKGYDDVDILAEYAKLYKDGQLMFPYRTDKRFVRECRKELDAAHTVLQGHLKIVAPTIIEQKKKHSAELTDITNCLLNNDLSSVLESSIISHVNTSSGQKESRQVEYIVDNRSDFGDPEKLTKEQLSDLLRRNLGSAKQKYTMWFLTICFLPHLEAELPEDVKAEGFWVGIIDEKPYELICALRMLAARKTFKGTCPVCKDWSP